MAYQITPITAGEFGMVRDDIKYRGGSPQITGYVPSYIYLLQQGKDQYLVDTSFIDPAFCARQMQLEVIRNKPLPQVLEHHGVIPDMVRGIFFTHLHWDHAGNISQFPNAVLYCQTREYEAALDPDAYPPQFLTEFREALPRLILLEGDQEPVPGIRVHLCKGHTPGSQMIETDTVQGPALIPGDVVMTMKNITRNIPVGLAVNPEDAAKALGYINSRAYSAVYPSHEYYKPEVTPCHY